MCQHPAGGSHGGCLKCRNPAERSSREHTTHLMLTLTKRGTKLKKGNCCRNSFSSLTSWRTTMAKTELLNFSTVVFTLYWDRRDSKIVLIFDRNCCTSKQKKKESTRQQLKEISTTRFYHLVPTNYIGLHLFSFSNRLTHTSLNCWWVLMIITSDTLLTFCKDFFGKTFRCCITAFKLQVTPREEATLYWPK